MKKVEVCFSPELFPVYFHSQDCIVVVIDIFRATSAMCTAFEHGVKKIIPVATLEEALEYKKKGYLVGAERGGEIVEGFDFGNSPFSYMGPEIVGQEIVLTTTNGTQALNIARAADQVVVGSFLNISSLCDWLNEQEKDVLLLCAGWKGRFNQEDTIFAGAVVEKLIRNPLFNELADSAISSLNLYHLAKSNLGKFLENSSHRRRLKKLNLEKDINYCLQHDLTSSVPVLEGGELVALNRYSDISQSG